VTYAKLERITVLLHRLEANVQGREVGGVNPLDVEMYVSKTEGITTYHPRIRGYLRVTLANYACAILTA
jgi:hypothetical protein